MAEDPDYYQRNWDEYYAGIGEDVDQVPWDVPSKDACAHDHGLFKDHLDTTLPVLDLGCGVGTQSVFLKDYFDRVIGADVSSEVIRIAKERYQMDGLEFEVLDALNLSGAEDFNRRHGDVNIYMRGTLQQILPEDRPKFMKCISTILGKKGCMYFVELSSKARNHFVELHKERGGIPETLKRVLANKVTALVGVKKEDIPGIFPDMEVVDYGDSTIALKLSKDEYTHIPSSYGILRNP